MKMDDTKGVPVPQGFQWINAKNGKVPSHAVNCGFDNGSLLYIGRAIYRGDLLPGKVYPPHGCCYIPFEEKEQSVKEYQVLCTTYGGRFDWKEYSNGQVPIDAVQGGVTEEGEPLFIGCCKHEKSLVPGKIQPSDLGLYIPHGGNAYFYRNYKVLVGNYKGGCTSEPPSVPDSPPVSRDPDCLDPPHDPCKPWNRRRC